MALRFYEGWAKYGNVGDVVQYLGTTQLTWNSINTNGYEAAASGATIKLDTGPTPNSLCYRNTGDIGAGSVYYLLRRALGGNYTTNTIGFWFRIDTLPTGNRRILSFEDGTTHQCALGVTSTGYLIAINATPTTVATSASPLSVGSWYFIEVTTVIDNSTGSIVVDVGGNNVISATNIDTQSSANAYASNFYINRLGDTGKYSYGPIYHRDDSTRMGEVTVETQFVTSDAALQFAYGQGTMGTYWRAGTGDVIGLFGNRLYLRKVTCPASGNLQSLRFLPSTSSGTAKYKAVIYADNGSGTAPTGSNLITPTEVVGVAANTTVTLPFSAALAVTKGTIYWIGFICDTAVNAYCTDNGLLGYIATNTYTNGVPSAPALTSTSSLMVYGVITGASSSWETIANKPFISGFNYVSSSTVGQQDLFGVSPLSSTPTTIYSARIYALTAKSDAGTRTVSLLAKSGSSTGTGSSSGQAQSVSFTWMSSEFTTDPNTGVAWTAAGLNNAQIGYRIDS